MSEQRESSVEIERIASRSIVLLKISRRNAERTREKLDASLAAQCLWHGPDQALLVSDSLSAKLTIEECEKILADVLHNAQEYSSGLAVFNLSGLGTRDLLAVDCGLDFRADRFPIGSCCRTKFAQIAAVISAEGPDVFDIYVDRNYEKYLGDWMRDELMRRPARYRVA